MSSTKKVLIVGGGLSALTLAYRLREKNVDVTILEAASRLGGRIQTIAGVLGTPLELGATWFSDVHIHLTELLAELNLAKYPQFSQGISLFQTKSFEPAQQFYIPAGETPSYRIAGGTQALIDTLAAAVNPEAIHLSSQVTAIRENPDTTAICNQNTNLTIETKTGQTFEADVIALCIPPQLAAATIDFSPALPEDLRSIMTNVHTWMAGAVKFVVEYETPFWREKGYSGMLYSHAGIVTEMYDHTNKEASRFGFTGFLAGGAANYTREVRQELVLRQLTGLLGEDAGRPATYLDKVWNDHLVVSGDPVILRPHQNQGHPALQMPYMEGKLFLCSTEVSAEHPGYMEGAAWAAKLVAEKIAGDR